MSLRDFLQSQGLSEKDIDEAVNEARGAAEVVHGGADILAKFLAGAAARVKNERVQRLLVMGIGFAVKVHEGTSELLAVRTHSTRVEAAPPPRAPSKKESR